MTDISRISLEHQNKINIINERIALKTSLLGLFYTTIETNIGPASLGKYVYDILQV